MDPQIKKRCGVYVMLFPYEKLVRGDKVFKDPYTLEAYVTFKDNISLETNSTEKSSFSAIYLDIEEVTSEVLATMQYKVDDTDNSLKLLTEIEKEALLNQTVKPLGRYVLSTGRRVQFTEIKLEDEIYLPNIGRVPIKRSRKYAGLKAYRSTLELLA